MKSIFHSLFFFSLTFSFSVVGQNLKNLSLKDAFPIIQKSSIANFKDLKTAESKSYEKFTATLSLKNSISNSVNSLATNHSFESVFRITSDEREARKTIDSLKAEFIQIFKEYNFTKVLKWGDEKYILTKIDESSLVYSGISIYLITPNSNQKSYTVYLDFNSNLNGVTFQPILVKADGNVISVELLDLIEESKNGFADIRGEEIEDETGFGKIYVSTKCLTGLQNCWISKVSITVKLESYVFVAENLADFEKGYNDMLYQFASSLGSDFCIVQTNDKTGFDFVLKSSLDNNYKPTVSFIKEEENGLIALKMNVIKPFGN